MAIRERGPIQVADDNGHPAAGEVVAEIDLDEFQDARRDPKWLSFRDGALARREQLKRDGRSA